MSFLDSQEIPNCNTCLHIAFTPLQIWITIGVCEILEVWALELILGKGYGAHELVLVILFEIVSVRLLISYLNQSPLKLSHIHMNWDHI